VILPKFPGDTTAVLPTDGLFFLSPHYFSMKITTFTIVSPHQGVDQGKPPPPISIARIHLPLDSGGPTIWDRILSLLLSPRPTDPWSEVLGVFPPCLTLLVVTLFDTQNSVPGFADFVVPISHHTPFYSFLSGRYKEATNVQAQFAFHPFFGSTFDLRTEKKATGF
jgi:hypothetical protein